ncbi:MAG: class I SAM-dependent methyltransferase [Thermoplasmata archaeon]
MEPEKAAAIKRAIQANFDASAASYDDFEGATGLFSFLARELAREAGVGPGMRVIDAGCGTGISTGILAALVGAGGRVLGIDISAGMVDAARRRLGGAVNVELLVGDVEELEALVSGPGKGEGGSFNAGGGLQAEAPQPWRVEGPWDAVLYTASIFLLPDARRSLRGALAVLRPGGVVGVNYIEGSYVEGRELFRELLPEWSGGERFPAPRFPCDVSLLPEILRECGFCELREGTVETELGLEGLRRFYQVPAQSASLYPKQRYEERREAVGRLFRLAEERGVSKGSMRWRWVVGRKRAPAPG